MDVLNKNAELKALCESFVKDPAFTDIKNVKDFDDLLAIIIKTLKYDYSLSKTTKELYRKNYSILQNDEDRFNLCLHWETDNLNVNYNNYKDIIIKRLNASADSYKLVVKMIHSDKLDFKILDVKKLPQDFITYFIKHCKLPEKFDTYEEDEMEERLYCTRCEIFLINCLPYYIETDRILEKLPDVTLPKLRILPIKSIILEGRNLLEQIYDYYSLLTIPPGIKYRRNLELLSNNKKHELYDYKKIKDKWIYSTDYSCITLEFPYMCYVYVQDAYLDVENRADAKDLKLQAWQGTDILHERVSNKDENGVIADKHTLVCNLGSEMPCTNLSYSIGHSKFMNVGNPQVTGFAIILL